MERVEELEFDDAFFEHMTAEARRYDKHIVAQREVMEVFRGNPVYTLNSGDNRRAPLIMLGPTRSARMIVVPLEPTHRRGVWRPVTAFEANAHHRGRYQKERGNG
ncbi:MAG: hypothetical protein J4F32_07005 [Dehalococcoidia bacterium]|nr:hypothetical protein [Dehalococcoidia bacterium]